MTKNNHLIKNFMEAINSQSIKAAKYSRSNVMTTAWALVKQLGYKLAEALSESWKREKARANKAYAKLSKEEKAVLNGKKTIKHTDVTLASMTSEQVENITNFYFNL